MIYVLITFIMVKLVESSVSICDYQAEYRLLNDGNRIPSVGFGTWENVTDLHNVIPSVTDAIMAGFRHLDTAHLYANEHLIGEALTNVFKRGIVKREDIFITTKLDATVPDREHVIPALKRNLRRLQLDYVDLFLIHSPFNLFDIPNFDIINIWKGMEDAKKLKLATSIGISNFNSSDINKLLRYANIRPAVNEIEVNPTNTNLDLVAYCQSQGIVVIAYAPFGLLVPRPFTKINNPPTFEDPVLMKIARKYGKESSQVSLRYLVDRGVIPIPHSKNRTHILLNQDLFDFCLTHKEVYAINEFNRNIPAYATPGEDFQNLFRHTYEYTKSIVPMFL